MLPSFVAESAHQGANNEGVRTQYADRAFVTEPSRT